MPVSPRVSALTVSSRMRALARATRIRRIVALPARVLDRARWARTILAADLVDLDYVRAQLGRRVSARTAVVRYVLRGYQRGMRLNPLFVDVSVGDHLPGIFRVPALYAYLLTDPSGVQVSPLWDAAEYLRRHPERVHEAGGAVGAAWRRRETESLPLGPGTSAAAEGWPVLRATVTAAAAAVRAGADADVGRVTGTPERELMLAFGPDETDFDESLAEAAAFAAAGGAVAIAVTGSAAEVWVQVALLARARAGVRAILRPHVSPVTAINELLSSSGARVAVVRGPDQALSADAAAALAVRAAAGAAVAPLWLDADGTVAALGAGREGRLLAGHPAEDATDLGGGVVRVPALAGVTFAVPRAVLAEPLREGDFAAGAGSQAHDAGLPIEVHTDLLARSRVAVPPPLLPPIADSYATLLAAAGWEVVAHGPSPRLRRPQRTHALPDGTRVPVLRWALKIAAPAGPRGEWWGDTHFARGLAGALRRLGQEVVIDAYPARSRATAHLDDVTLALRGPEPIEPPSTGIRMIWVISHPDEITGASLEGFDLVFAASEPWAAAASARFGRDIRPLLQCTDPTRFVPTGLRRTGEIVFVGTARGIRRPSVVDPVEAGVPVRVYGPDWREWIPAAAIAGTGVANAELPAVYERAGVVLNDHWPAMQERGFIANRPYDVVAAGGRVISDHVEGLAEHFEGAVVTYRSVDELLALLTGDLDAVFPAEQELAGIAGRVRERDSFDARARTLLDAALARR